MAYVEKVIALAKKLEDEFSAILSIPFLWDASERNVIVDQGKITGIVDVDDICFGDPLLVIGLTATELEYERYDTLYADYWADALNLGQKAKDRLLFYRLFYVIVFMRKHHMITSNNQKITFDTVRLENIFQTLLAKIEHEL